MSKVNHFLSFIKTKSKLNRIQAILAAWARVLVLDIANIVTASLPFGQLLIMLVPCS